MEEPLETRAPIPAPQPLLPLGTLVGQQRSHADPSLSQPPRIRPALRLGGSRSPLLLRRTQSHHCEFSLLLVSWKAPSGPFQEKQTVRFTGDLLKADLQLQFQQHTGGQLGLSDKTGATVSLCVTTGQEGLRAHHWTCPCSLGQHSAQNGHRLQSPM